MFVGPLSSKKQIEYTALERSFNKRCNSWNTNTIKQKKKLDFGIKRLRTIIRINQNNQSNSLMQNEDWNWEMFAYAQEVKTSKI